MILIVALVESSSRGSLHPDAVKVQALVQVFGEGEEVVVKYAPDVHLHSEVRVGVLGRFDKNLDTIILVSGIVAILVILAGNSNPWRDLGTLATATVAFAALAFWRFEKRDV